MRYFLNLLLYIPVLLIAAVITPFLPIFAQQEGGFSDNGAWYKVEPRLPTWLSWFMTPDNSLLGDARWLRNHPKGTYWNMVAWLYRNPLYGFKWTVLALPEGHSDAWQWHRKYYFKSFYFDLNFGWMLDNPQNGVLMFHISPRIKRL